jgi:glycosyltransferase involved in cell wall biosynthesis
MHDERYATTRRLVTEKPVCFDNSVDDIKARLKTPDSDQKIAEGGLRFQGFFKKESEEKPIITVVTVVYNGAEFLEDTIKSVIEQTYDNVEYIIVDGGSTDGTVDIVRKYEHAIDYWVSEPDKGIYNAMNKGIDLGGGDWVNFMNAGDRFYKSNTIFDVVNEFKHSSDFVILYGHHEVRYPDKKKLVKAGLMNQLWRGSQFSHQSAFILLSYHKKNPYNLCRKIAADFEFFYHTYRSDKKIVCLPDIISSITSGGISDIKRIDSILEWWSIIEKSNKVNINYSFRVVFEVFKSAVKKKLRS